MVHVLQGVLHFAVMDQSEQIGGNGVEVEIDESKFGKRKYHRGHKVEGQWVFGGRKKYNKHKIFMIPVHNRKATTLLPLIKKWIAPGSIIHSDCWKAYNGLTKMGYTHVTVNQSKEFVQNAQMPLKVTGDMLRYTCLHMVCIWVTMLDTWQNSCSTENTVTVTNSLPLSET